MTSGLGPTNAIPACSTLRANDAFSERKPYLRLSCNGERMNRAISHILGIKNIPGMDHVDAVLDGDAEDVVLREVRADGREALADLVRLIGL